VAEAAEVVAEMRSEIRALVDQIPEFDEPVTFYHELDQTYFSVTSPTFIGQIYRLVGLRNIADHASGAAPDYPQLSGEFIIRADPDIIFLADTKCCDQSATTVARRPGWDQISAVRTGAVVELDDDVASRCGAQGRGPAAHGGPGTVHARAGEQLMAATDAGWVELDVRPTRLGVGPPLVALGLLLMAALAAILIDPVRLSSGGVVRELLDRFPLVDIRSGLSERDGAILWQLRVPRVVLGGLVGAMLAMAGASYRGSFGTRWPIRTSWGGCRGRPGRHPGRRVPTGLVLLAGSTPCPSPRSRAPSSRSRAPMSWALGQPEQEHGHADPSGGGGGRVLHGGPDVRAAAPRRHPPGGVRVWILGGVGTVGWRQVGLILPYVAASGLALILHRRLLDVMSLGDEEADSRHSVRALWVSA
jgi:hypothetical protein